VVVFRNEEAVSMDNEIVERWEEEYRARVDEEFRRKGVRPIRSISDLRGGAGFDEEGELDEFLAYLDESRSDGVGNRVRSLDEG
jgi:hypothetical protein